jgi:hypothetical protein
MKLYPERSEGSQCHDCAGLGPNVKFRMELSGPNEAHLWELKSRDSRKDLGPGLNVVRQATSSPEPAKRKCTGSR